MNNIEVFLQGAGVEGTKSVSLRDEATVSELVEAAYLLGVVRGNELTLFSEECEEQGEDQALVHIVASDPHKLLKDLGIGHGCGVHLHHHPSLKVSVNYNAGTHHHELRPGATVGKVLAWAVDKFKIDPNEATEFGLFLCGRQDEALPDGMHIGSLTAHGSRELCFDLSPKHRVQG